MSTDVPTLFAHWEQLVVWLFQHTAKFPARLRHSLTARIETRALDIHEGLVGARFTRDRAAMLRELNVDLDRLRLLLRLAHELQAMDHRAFHHACAEIDTAGRMLGGWTRQQAAP
jgi:hypothetical protein